MSPKVSPKCTRWPRELNHCGTFFGIVGHYFRKKCIPKGSPFNFFRSFATEWMLKIPKGFPSIFFGIVRLFKKNHKRVPPPIHQYSDTLKSFAIFEPLIWRRLGPAAACLKIVVFDASWSSSERELLSSKLSQEGQQRYSMHLTGVHTQESVSHPHPHLAQSVLSNEYRNGFTATPPNTHSTFIVCIVDKNQPIRGVI